MLPEKWPQSCCKRASTKAGLGPREDRPESSRFFRLGPREDQFSCFMEIQERCSFSTHCVLVRMPVNLWAVLPGSCPEETNLLVAVRFPGFVFPHFRILR